jgi:hypothetical protein
MATAEKSATTQAAKPLLPPDERFWKRYSPHHEFPLASATSVFVHGLVIGAFVVGGLLLLSNPAMDMSAPVHTDVVAIDGPGFGELGGAPAGEPGFPGAPGTELTPGPPGSGEPDENASPGAEIPDLPSLGAPTLDVPSPDAPFEAPDETLLDQLKFGKLPDNVGKPAKTPSAGKSGSGTNNPKGVGGMNGPGGRGKGSKPGPGKGAGGIGRQATEQEIKAWRWSFELSGNPKEHADQLDRSGVVVAVPDPNAGNLDIRSAPLLLISDVKRRPVTVQRGALADFKDAVKWSNRDPASVQALAKELQLPFVPAYIVLLLPKEREKKMVAEEERYAQRMGVDVANVRRTVFAFRLQNGVYEPVVIRQE